MQDMLPGLESEITVNGSELADWLAVTPGAVTRMVQRGELRQLEGGRYPLKASVQAVVKKLRGRKAGQGETKDLERSLKYWQVEKSKQQVLSWRLSYGRDLASALLSHLDGAFREFQKAVAGIPEANAAALRFADAMKATKPSEVVEELGGDDEDDLDDDND